MSFEEPESPQHGDGSDAPAGQQFLSRRELREAERRSLEATPQRVEPVETSRPAQRVEPVETSSDFDFGFPPSPAIMGVAPSASVDAERAARRERKEQSIAKVSRAVASKRESTEPGARKLRRAEVRLVNRADAPKRERKNPLSVLVTMLAVGGLVAVTGLPAFASLTNQTIQVTQAKTDAESQDLIVPAAALGANAARDGFSATSPEALAQMSRDALRAEANAAYLASGARELGDDYPWPYELTEGQGGGLSPLNYYYRECVDFVAWRLNRDQGYYSAPFKWVWSTLTPWGGNGGQWMYAWQQKGWPVSNTPVPGAVAYTGGNHVAYVKSVNADGTVTLEEYNYVPHAYSQRTIPASSVVAFLYPPS